MSAPAEIRAEPMYVTRQSVVTSSGHLLDPDTEVPLTVLGEEVLQEFLAAGAVEPVAPERQAFHDQAARAQYEAQRA